MPRAGTPITKPRSYLAVGKPHHRVAVPRGKHQRIFPLATSLTEPQIHKVRAHAVKHGFHDLMFACDRALAGSFRARVAIARWLKGGQATSR